MLAIRLQRTGRSGHAQFRLIVQDSRFSPTRGRVVSYLGNYDPHTKTATIDGEKAAHYLENGAQPSDRVARLFKKEGVKLPAWVKLDEPKNRAVRNPAKRRSTAPAQPEAPAAPAEPAAEETAAEPAEQSQPEPAAADTAPEPDQTLAEATPEPEAEEAAPAQSAPAAEEPAEAPAEEADTPPESPEDN